MEKGKYGIRLCFYTVSAFILAYLGYSTVLFLLAGVVLLAEKNEWATRQIIQAICLCVARNLVSAVLGVFDFLYEIPIISHIWGVADGLVEALVSIFVLVFCIVGVLKNLKGNDADIIGARKFADWAYGIVKVQPQPAPAPVPQPAPTPAPQQTSAETPQPAPESTAAQTENPQQ